VAAIQIGRRGAIVGSISVCGEPTAARGVVEEVTAVVEEAAAVLASPLHLAGEGG
jgi:hypothetical protein